MTSRRAGRVDKMHAPIRETLRLSGYEVIDTSQVGDDFPDLLAVSKKGVIVLLEVKTEGKYPTEGQVRFLTGFSGPCSLVFNPEHALDVMSRYD